MGMLSVDEALDLIARHVEPLTPRSVPTHTAYDLMLAEPITSPIDSPPFDKSMVDGYAVRSSDAGAHRSVVEEVMAGALPTREVTPGSTTRIMTGAPMPSGADAVVKREDVDESDPHRIDMLKSRPEPGYCVQHRGASFREGDSLIEPGTVLGPAHLALLSEIGKSRLNVTPKPTVAVLPTGDELVDYDQVPEPGQIRNSNGPMLSALLAELRIDATELGIGRDDPEDLKRRITEGLSHDVLILSGGVSAGDKDLVPGILNELGVGEVLHRVRVKPGKPVWFGVHERDGGGSLVFGLPGNPVSSFVAYRLFVLPALMALSGSGFCETPTEQAKLIGHADHRGPRPSYQPALVGRQDGAASVEVLPWRGSADLASLSRANALAVLPPGTYRLDPGALIEILPL